VGPGSGAATPVPTIAGDTKERAKPGPKANPGGINEKLRALDRSGKPTRRWKKVLAVSGEYVCRVCFIRRRGLLLVRLL
jgi:hypothetical protein